ncbi:MAG: DUF1624 domain-containing protein [Lachnospiraceae bacterium]|nr:DUF1624 domain-containing protein [Lachnospiraceae bacterium]
MENGTVKKRYAVLDLLRGLTLVSMIFYHGMWDLVYMAGVSAPWYQTGAGYIWQQSICWTFILLSGFCQPFGKRKLKRALLVSGGGLLVTGVTLIFMPSNRVVFGVLTLIGFCMLFWAVLEKQLLRIPPFRGLIGSMCLFGVTRNVNSGWLGFEGLNLQKLPDSLYCNLFTAWLGFPASGFYSTDYFSVFPWIFLYGAGFYLHLLLKKNGGSAFGPLEKRHLPWIEWLGRNSLLIYLLHQPILYGTMMVYQFIF